MAGHWSDDKKIYYANYYTNGYKCDSCEDVLVVVHNRGQGQKECVKCESIYICGNCWTKEEVCDEDVCLSSSCMARCESCRSFCAKDEMHSCSSCCVDVDSSCWNDEKDICVKCFSNKYESCDVCSNSYPSKEIKYCDICDVKNCKSCKNTCSKCSSEVCVNCLMEEEHPCYICNVGRSCCRCIMKCSDCGRCICGSCIDSMFCIEPWDFTHCPKCVL